MAQVKYKVTCKRKDCTFKGTWRLDVEPERAWHEAKVAGKKEQHPLRLERIE